jgi:hypothetical protein
MSNVIWLGGAGAALLVVIAGVLLRLLRRPSTPELGSVSSDWMAAHRSSRD